jgi:RNA polymerase sigma-70 factor, ECF subfamily
MLSLYAHETPFLSDIGATRPKLSSLPQDDAGLVRAALAGDRASEEQLYLRHVHYVNGLLVRLLGSQAEAEDAVQETFVIALDRLAELREPAAFRGWLAQIAVSQAGRRFRRAKLLRVLGLHRGEDAAVMDSLPAPHASLEAQADVATIAQLVARLAADVRVAWLLRYVAGESLDEVAEDCRCSLATAKRRIASANAFIHAELGEPEGAPR